MRLVECQKFLLYSLFLKVEPDKILKRIRRSLLEPFAERGGVRGLDCLAASGVLVECLEEVSPEAGFEGECLLECHPGGILRGLQTRLEPAPQLAVALLRLEEGLRDGGQGGRAASLRVVRAVLGQAGRAERQLTRPLHAVLGHLLPVQETLHTKL